MAITRSQIGGAPAVDRLYPTDGIRPRNGPALTKGNAFFAYADNYLIDLKAAIVVDVEATRAIWQ
jgi:hypothetical protein